MFDHGIAQRLLVLTILTIAGLTGCSGGGSFVPQPDGGATEGKDGEGATDGASGGSRGRDAGSAPEPDGGLGASDPLPVGGPACAPTTPFSIAPIEAELGVFKGPGPRQPTACSSQDLETFGHNLSAPRGNWLSLSTGLTSSCRACIYSSTVDARWGPIVLGAADGSTGFINFAACPAVENGSASCGEAYHYAQMCMGTTCDPCNGSQECLGWATAPGGRCAARTTAVKEACPNLSTSEFWCGGTLTQHVARVCSSQ